jgi:hypothetical protein
MRGLHANHLRERRTVLQDDPPISSTKTAIERFGSDRFIRTPNHVGTDSTQTGNTDMGKLCE